MPGLLIGAGTLVLLGVVWVLSRLYWAWRERAVSKHLPPPPPAGKK